MITSESSRNLRSGKPSSAKVLHCQVWSIHWSFYVPIEYPLILIDDIHIFLHHPGAYQIICKLCQQHHQHPTYLFLKGSYLSKSPISYFLSYYNNKFHISSHFECTASWVIMVMHEYSFLCLRLPLVNAHLRLNLGIKLGNVTQNFGCNYHFTQYARISIHISH